jgi:hypothetical protein
MERKTQTGYLVLADISGYTSFVAQTEIEHADMALSFLLETILEKIGSLLIIGQLEGSESTGWKGYALFTNRSLERMRTDKTSFVQQTESYEHLGEVETYVRDMHVRYEAMKAS